MNLVCPECGGKEVQTVSTYYQFPYGAGEQRVLLTALVPMRRCRRCPAKWFDYEAEDKMTEAQFRWEKTKGVIRSAFASPEEKDIWDRVQNESDADTHNGVWL